MTSDLLKMFKKCWLRQCQSLRASQIQVKWRACSSTGCHKFNLACTDINYTCYINLVFDSPIVSSYLFRRNCKWAQHQWHGRIMFLVASTSADPGRRARHYFPYVRPKTLPKLKIQDPKSKFKNPKSKITNPKSAKKFNFGFWTLDFGFWTGDATRFAGAYWSVWNAATR